jgi:ribosomal protein L11 methyltransferase
MEMSWLEVSIDVDGEAAEAVSEVFNRFGRGGAVIETIYSTDDTFRPDPQPVARIKTYLSPDDVDTRRRIEEALWFLGRLYPMPEPSFRVLKEEDWAQAWKKSYRPLRIGAHLMIVPSWWEFTAQRGDVIVELDPGMAFGTGLHPTTRMCLESLELIVQPGQHVLDVGAGSGILSIAAVRLGAASVLAVEKDALAADVARENVARNRVQDVVQVETGSLEAVSGQFDLLLINILAEVIVSLVDTGLLKHLKSTGRFIAAGIVEDRAADVVAAVEAHGAVIVERRQQKDWVTLIGALA